MRFERLLSAPTLSQPDACGLSKGESAPQRDNSKFRGRIRPRRARLVSSWGVCPANPSGIDFSLIANHLRTFDEALTNRSCLDSSPLGSNLRTTGTSIRSKAFDTSGQNAA
jgi:hypothetical protein